MYVDISERIMRRKTAASFIGVRSLSRLHNGKQEWKAWYKQSPWNDIFLSIQLRTEEHGQCGTIVILKKRAEQKIKRAPFLSSFYLRRRPLNSAPIDHMLVDGVFANYPFLSCMRFYKRKEKEKQALHPGLQPIFWFCCPFLFLLLNDPCFFLSSPIVRSLISLARHFAGSS